MPLKNYCYDKYRLWFTAVGDIAVILIALKITATILIAGLIAKRLFAVINTAFNLIAADYYPL